MITLTFYGASDDLIEIESSAGTIEVLDPRDGSVYGDGETNGEHGEFLLHSPGDDDGRKGIVSVDYMPDGFWRVGFRPAEEHEPSFSDIRVGVMTFADRGYPPEPYRGFSGKLEIEVPDDTRIFWHGAVAS